MKTYSYSVTLEIPIHAETFEDAEELGDKCIEAFLECNCMREHKSGDVEVGYPNIEEIGESEVKQ